MPFLHADGLAVHYRLSGTPGRPRLVFVNSLGSDLRIWGEVEALLAPDFEILAYDKRGHGLTDLGSPPYAIATLAGDLQALMEALAFDKVSIVGLSVGGLIAQEFAVARPERVEALVLMDTAARIGTAESWNARMAAVETAGLASISGDVIARWFTDAFRSRQPAALAGWRTMLERTSAAGYAGTCAALRDADLTARIPAIRAPTLAIVGDGDLSTPPDLVRATADLIPGSRFAVIAGAGHLPCLEQPVAVADLVRRHVQGARTADDAPSPVFETGIAVRRAVLGNAHVDRATAAITPFDADFQRFITEGAWGSVWSRPHFSRRERSIVTITLLAALGHDEEVAMHVRATANTFASEADIAEALMHVAVYAGVPAANHAIRIAKRIFAEMRDAAAVAEGGAP